jgi:rhodanese-related sulfurtransferase/glyoxylase-like metal-dependent hydrolase (beta-lactamase superfamily II)
MVNMFFQQYYLECLSHASYMVGDTTTGMAVVIDPQRDIDQYVADAQANGLRIVKVIETHFHADFLSGHLELAAATGASIVFGAAAKGRVEFDIETMAHGSHISLGDVDLEILETPGHTPESISVVVRENGPTGTPFGVLTGDTMFIGDVGRPDLLSSVGVTADQLARQLFDSLHNKLLLLPDDTKVFPAHGAGSSCGKQLSTETVSTIGEQRRVNYALAPMVIDDFVDVVTEGQNVAPEYFPFAANRNREARPLLDDDAPMKELTAPEAVALAEHGAVILDSRDDQSFASGYIRGSVNVGLSGRFAEYAGEVMKPGTAIVIVSDAGFEREARTRLARIGFDNVVGCISNPELEMLNNPQLVEKQSRLSVESLAERMASLRELVVIDVRNGGETALGMLPGARNIPLPALLREIPELDPNVPVVVNCAGGYRSSVASSLLKSHGFTDVSDLIGGYNAWADSNIPHTLPAIDVKAAQVYPNALLVDVREQNEWDAGHIEGAVHIPMAHLPDRLEELDKKMMTIVVCRSGNRSGKVAAWLINRGYDALNMTGGMLAWSEQGLAEAK